MSQTTAQPAQPAPAPTPAPLPTAGPLGHKVVRGFSWMLAKTLGTKAVNFGGQIILAWLLVPQDFGLIGLAYTVTAFISVLQKAGLQEILIHRQSRFRRWANPVFWLSGCLGVVGMGLTLAAIPLATRLYDAPQLAGLLAILSINALVGSLSVVPRAKLSNALRFKAIAAIGVSSAAFNILVACLLAWAGWGAYAIALGTTGGVIINTLLQWKAAPVRLKHTMQMRRWRFLFGDSAAILATGILLVLVFQGDYIVLGIFQTTAIVGLYFFAFGLSTQTVSLFTSNLSRVLFPALAQLQSEPKRHTEAFLRATRLLAWVVIPVCLAQAAVADPLIRLIFPAKWYAAIPVLQILCIGMAFRAVGSPGGTMMQSQGRFRTMLIFTVVYSTVYMALITTAAMWGGILSVAVAEALCFGLVGPFNLFVAIYPNSRDWRAILRLYLLPMAGSAMAFVPGVVVSEMIPWIASNHLLRIAAVLLPAAPLYLLLMWQWSRKDATELWQKAKRVMPRAFRRHVPAL